MSSKNPAIKCKRCGGSGKIPAFNHIQNGVCFRCHGVGVDPEFQSQFSKKPKVNKPVGAMSTKPLGSLFTKRNAMMAGALVIGAGLAWSALSPKDEGEKFSFGNVTHLSAVPSRREKVVQKDQAWSKFLSQTKNTGNSGSGIGSAFAGKILSPDLENKIYADSLIQEGEYRQYIEKLEAAQKGNQSLQTVEGPTARHILDKMIWWRNPRSVMKVDAELQEKEQLGQGGSYNSGSKKLIINSLVNPNQMIDALGRTHDSTGDPILDTLRTSRILSLASPTSTQETVLHEGLHAVWDIDMDGDDKQTFYDTALDQVNRAPEEIDQDTDVLNIGMKHPVYMDMLIKAHITAQRGQTKDNPYVNWMANEMWAHRGVTNVFDNVGYYLPENKELQDITKKYIRHDAKEAKKSSTPWVEAQGQYENVYNELIDEQERSHSEKNQDLILPSDFAIQFSQKKVNSARELKKLKNLSEYKSFNDPLNGIQGLHPGSEGMGAQAIQSISDFGSRSVMGKLLGRAKNMFRHSSTDPLEMLSNGMTINDIAEAKGYKILDRNSSNIEDYVSRSLKEKGISDPRSSGMFDRAVSSMKKTNYAQGSRMNGGVVIKGTDDYYMKKAQRIIDSSDKFKGRDVAEVAEKYKELSVMHEMLEIDSLKDIASAGLNRRGASLKFGSHASKKVIKKEIQYAKAMGDDYADIMGSMRAMETKSVSGYSTESLKFARASKLQNIRKNESLYRAAPEGASNLKALGKEIADDRRKYYDLTVSELYRKEGLHPMSQGMGAQSVKAGSDFGSGYIRPAEQWQVEDEDISFGMLRTGATGIGIAAAAGLGYGILTNKAILTSRLAEDAGQRGRRSVAAKVAAHIAKSGGFSVKQIKEGKTPNVNIGKIFSKGEQYLGELGYNKRLVKGGLVGLGVGAVALGIGATEIAGASIAGIMAGAQREEGEESQMRHEAAFALKDAGYRWMGIGGLATLGGIAAVTQASKVGEDQFSKSTKFMSNMSLEDLPVKPGGKPGQILNSLPQKVKQFKPFGRKTVLKGAALLAGIGTLTLGHELLLNKKISANRGSIAERDFNSYDVGDYLATLATDSVEVAGMGALTVLGFQRSAILYRNAQEYLKVSGKEHLNFYGNLGRRLQEDIVGKKEMFDGIKVKGIKANKIGSFLSSFKKPKVLKAGLIGAGGLAAANMLHQGFDREEINFGAMASMMPSVIGIGGAAGIVGKGLYDYNKTLKATGSSLGMAAKAGFSNLKANTGDIAKIGKEGLSYAWHVIKTDLLAKSKAGVGGGAMAMTKPRVAAMAAGLAAGGVLTAGLTISGLGSIFQKESIVNDNHSESMAGFDTRMKEIAEPIIYAGIAGKVAAEGARGYFQYKVLESGKDLNVLRPFKSQKIIENLKKQKSPFLNKVGRSADWFFEGQMKSQGTKIGNIKEVMKGKKGLALGIGLVALSMLGDTSARKDPVVQKPEKYNRAFNPIEGVHPGSEGMGTQSVRAHSDFGTSILPLGARNSLKKSVQLFRGTVKKATSHKGGIDLDKLDPTNRKVEELFEGIRKKEFPHRPSRLEGSYWSPQKSIAEKYAKGQDAHLSSVTKNPDDIFFANNEEFIAGGVNLNNPFDPDSLKSAQANVRKYWTGISYEEAMRIPSPEAIIPGVTKAEKTWHSPSQILKKVKEEIPAGLHSGVDDNMAAEMIDEWSDFSSPYKKIYGMLPKQNLHAPKVTRHEKVSTPAAQVAKEEMEAPPTYKNVLHKKPAILEDYSHSAARNRRFAKRAEAAVGVGLRAAHNGARGHRNFRSTMSA